MSKYYVAAASDGTPRLAQWYDTPEQAEAAADKYLGDSDWMVCSDGQDDEVDEEAAWAGARVMVPDYCD